MISREQQHIGEIEERREPLYPGVGFSKGNPNKPGEPRPSIPVISGTLSPFFVRTIAQKILNTNPLRASLHFQNRSVNTIWIGVKQSPGNFQVGAVPLAAFELSPGAVWEPEINGKNVFYDDIWAVSSADDMLLVVLETINISA